jgi:hypothetical protein
MHFLLLLATSTLLKETWPYHNSSLVMLTPRECHAWGRQWSRFSIILFTTQSSRVQYPYHQGLHLPWSSWHASGQLLSLQSNISLCRYRLTRTDDTLAPNLCILIHQCHVYLKVTLLCRTSSRLQSFSNSFAMRRSMLCAGAESWWAMCILMSAAFRALLVSLDSDFQM